MPDDPFDIPLLRPRIGRRADAERTFGDQLRDALRGFRVGHAAKGKEPKAPGPEPTRQRRVVVKAHVVKLGPKGRAACAKHLAYLERDGVAEDEGRGVLFDAHDDVDRAAFAGERPGEKVQFRFIIAPEDGADLEMRDYVRRVMARMESDLCRRLEWAAVVHYDNGHPHAHVVVRGVDRDGRPLRIPRKYISHGLREQAQEIATQDLGPRTRADLERQREREVKQERFTSLDRELVRRARDGEVTVDGRGARDAPLTDRLHHLAALELVTRTGRHTWRLEDNFERTLRSMGDRGDIVRTMHAAMGGNPARFEVDLEGRVPLQEETVARLVRKVAADELRGGIGGIFETATGRAVYVPLGAETAQALREGDLAVLTPDRAPERSKADARGVQEPAWRDPAEDLRRARERASGAVKDPERPSRPRGKARPGRPPRSATERAAELDRLLGGDSERSGERSARPVRAKPLGTSLEEAVQLPGASWLDTARSASWPTTGFGAELRRAKEAREAIVREPEARRAREAERIVKATGLAHATSPSAPFRGRLMREGAGPDAIFYVSDGRTFTVLDRGVGDPRLVGRTVNVRREPDGRVVVKTPERER